MVSKPIFVYITTHINFHNDQPPFHCSRNYQTKTSQKRTYFDVFIFNFYFCNLIRFRSSTVKVWFGDHIYFVICHFPPSLIQFVAAGLPNRIFFYFPAIVLFMGKVALLKFFSKNLLHCNFNCRCINLILYTSTTLHLPPLSFHCVGGCWAWTRDCCNVRIDIQIP